MVRSSKVFLFAWFAIPVLLAARRGIARSDAPESNLSKKNPDLSPTERRVINNLSQFIKNRFAGDWKKAFDSYAGPDGLLDENELEEMFDDGAIVDPLFSGEAASRVIGMLDTDKDEKISWAEFQAKFAL